MSFPFFNKSIKVGLSPSKKKVLFFFFFPFNQSPLKMMKIAFYLILKALFILKIFQVLPCFFGHLEKRLDYKIEINFNI